MKTKGPAKNRLRAHALAKGHEASDLDRRIVRLEKRIFIDTLKNPDSVPGTSFTRILASRPILERAGLELPPSKWPDDASYTRNESFQVWSLGVGELAEPKVFFYGFTMLECLTRAEAHLFRKKKFR